ncbi:kinase-like domain-containing protein [Rhizophagus irregularis DAOM 181602=DAOM 197198]|nr:kinase-like domain-containing protein [Rhizophagus irregularis DAOM 181602=DAOM 197198]
MPNNQIDSKTNNPQIIQNFDKMNLKEIEPIINDHIFEGELSIVIDVLVDLIFKELNQGEDNIVVKKIVLDFIKNHKITLYNYLLNDQSNSNSICLLGYFYCYGIENEVNEQRAIELYQKAANLENRVAQFNLVNEYTSRKVLETYYSRVAFELSKKLADDNYAYGSANLGNSAAQYYLAKMYENGNEVKKDINNAIYWYKKSAKQENTGAQLKLKVLSKK